jgi:uncharacterized protein
MSTNAKVLSWTALLCLALGAALAAPAQSVKQIDWSALLPAAERDNYNPSPPPAVHDYLGEGSMAALQTGSYTSNNELNGARVRIPGFVVPLERGRDGLIDEFFLVPYFGACIHVPPPPTRSCTSRCAPAPVSNR